MLDTGSSGLARNHVVIVRRVLWTFLVHNYQLCDTPATKLIAGAAHDTLFLMARPVVTQLSIFDGTCEMEDRLDPLIGYFAWEFTQCALPLSKPKALAPGEAGPDPRRQWVKQVGDVEMLVFTDPDTDAEVPYGRIARIVMAKLCSEAIRNNSPVINLGPSMAGFLRSMGMESTGGPYGTRNTVGEQVIRLVNSNFKIRWLGAAPSAQDDDLHGSQGRAMRFATYWNVWWSTSDNDNPEGRRPTHPTKDSVIVLSDDFMKFLRKRPIPFYFEALQLLGHSALAMDLYVYFVTRLPKIDKGKPDTLKDHELVNLFSSRKMPTGATARAKLIFDVRRDIEEQMESVLSVYHEAKVQLVKGGLLMHHSVKHVPPRGEHAKARARRVVSRPLRKVRAAAIDHNRGRRPTKTSP